MNPAARYLARQEVSLGDEGDEGAVLFNADTGNVMIINPTGRMVWEFLTAPRSIPEIAAHLATRFQKITEAEAAEDVEAFLQRLLPEYVEEIETHDSP